MVPSSEPTGLSDAARPADGVVKTIVPPAHPPRTLEDVARKVEARVAAFLAEEALTPLLAATQAQVRIALDVVDKALRDYKHSELSVAYNGGKDCLVLLILILACLARRYPTTSSGSTAEPFPSTIQAVYIVSAHPFTEVDTFVDESSRAYHLELVAYALPMQAALAAYLGDHGGVRAVFVGTRRTDPHGELLTHFDRTDTDKGWPDFMRIHPVIDWHYAEIWAFIRHLQIPYCPLYDQGYTSLGGTTDTQPNPALKAEVQGQNFRPAYELMDDDEERLGRGR